MAHLDLTNGSWVPGLSSWNKQHRTLVVGRCGGVDAQSAYQQLEKDALEEFLLTLPARSADFGRLTVATTAEVTEGPNSSTQLTY